MAEKEVWTPPPDPDFVKMAEDGWEAYKRDHPKLLAFDTETSGVMFFDAPFCVTAAWRNSSGIECHYFELPGWRTTPHPRVEEMMEWMFRKTPKLVGHNIKFDLQKGILNGFIDRHTIMPSRVHDTEALAHLDDEHRRKGLKDLAVSVLGVDDTISVEIKSGANKGQIKKVPREKAELDAIRRKLKVKKDDGYEVLPRASIVPYALKDALFTLQLYERLYPAIRKHPDLLGLYEQEMALTLVFLDMEDRGMGVDIEYVEDKIREYGNRVLATELAIERITGRSVGKEKGMFNPNSNPQIAAVFAGSGIVRPKYDEEVLREIDHPLAEKLLELRGDMKTLNTYFRALKSGTRRGVFHPSIRQHGTVTGRTSSGGARGDG